MASDRAVARDIRHRIARDFRPADARALLSNIAAQRAAAPDVFFDRVVRCVVYVANGDLPTAERAIAMALADWRDLIVWAEYDNKFADRLRDLSVPFE